jgi:cellulose synthase/poly-beta-1,6-N-acetylglucosamine synthase-like glycosyltransferase
VTDGEDQHAQGEHVSNAAAAVLEARPRLERVDAVATHPVVVLIPAHNEHAQIAETITSLLTQTRPPDRVVVVADNCTDETADIAQRLGVEVFVTVGNTAKKAGALNQALGRLLPTLADDDRILVMDADSSLDERFLEAADERLSRGDVAACGGVFLGKPGGGLVGMFQRNEYARYARDVGRLKGKVLVLTGTATMFRAGTLREVARERGTGRLPGAPGAVYDTRVLTEDNELTLALLHLGHEIVSPQHCRLTTEVMPTWRELWHQRLRWKRGALENLVDYGWTPVTCSYWLRQLLSLIGVLVTLTYVGTVALDLALSGSVQVHAIWLVVTGIFSVERIVTVRRRGPVQMLIASTILIEMAFDVFLQVCQGKAFADAALGRERKW